MTDRTYVLIPGAGGSAWYWHRLVPELRRRGHDAVAVDLPAADDSAGLWEYADTLVNAVGDRDNVVVVAPFDPLVYFFHDVPAHIAEEGMTTEQPQSSTPFTQPWPLAAWPDVPTRVLSGRQDRLFPRGVPIPGRPAAPRHHAGDDGRRSPGCAQPA
jgi:pimeloyl-ACP methyl ester carboxylesterase